MHARAVLITMVLLVAVFAGGCAVKEFHVTVTINEDGSAKTRYVVSIDRTMMEQGMRAMAGDDEDDEDLTQEQKDKRLADEVRENFETSTVFPDADAVTPKLEKVEVKKDVVRMIVTFGFKDLKTFVSYAPQTIGGGMALGVRLEKDEKGKLRVVVTPATRRYALPGPPGRVRDQLAAAPVKGSIKLIFPGKVLSSTLPTTKDNTTSITFDTADEKSREALAKFIEKGGTVTAEPGKLKLDMLPLDSVKLAPPTRIVGRDEYRDLKTVDAGPGWRARGSAVTTTTVHHFDEARKVLKEDSYHFSAHGENRCEISGRLFPPAGRHVLSLVSVKVLKAVDDKDREVRPAADGVGTIVSHGMRFNDDERKRGVPFTLTLELPKPDAEAVEELKGETVVVTFGKWKEQVLRNLNADPKKEIDLGAVVPGAVMTVLKVTQEQEDRDDMHTEEGSVRVKITGPAEIARIKLKLHPENRADEHSYESSTSRRRLGRKHLRHVTVEYSMGYGGNDNRGAPGKLVLTVRCPDELKRERVKFALEALDLF